MLQIAKVQLYFAKPSLELKSVTLTDLTGGQSSFFFSKISYAKVKDSVFEYKIPDSAKFIVK